MKTYTHLGIFDLNSTLESLPAMPEPAAANFRLPLACQESDKVCKEMEGKDSPGKVGKSAVGKKKASQTPENKGVC